MAASVRTAAAFLKYLESVKDDVTSEVCVPTSVVSGTERLSAMARRHSQDGGGKTCQTAGSSGELSGYSRLIGNRNPVE